MADVVGSGAGSRTTNCTESGNNAVANAFTVTAADNRATLDLATNYVAMAPGARTCLVVVALLSAGAFAHGAGVP